MAKQKQSLILKDIDKLLSQQTVVILGAVDKKLEKERKEADKLLSQQTIIILSTVDKKLEKFEKKISARVDKLRNTIDKFVVLYTKQEQEFTIMKEDLKRLETRIAKLEEISV